MRWNLVGGAPDEPDTNDWDAICSAPGPNSFFDSLFAEVANFSLPAPKVVEESEDDINRVHAIWCGTEQLGVKVIEIECAETTAFPMHSIWESFGLPGMKLLWKFSLDYAGQLGFCAFRHGSLECEFAADEDRARFSRVWEKVFSRAPAFEPAE